ncbi:MAG: S1 RNA-binding domain-containing protein, partial [Oscillospiraceae bacterium]
EQSAGFMRIMDGENILDNTGVHPESYKAAQNLLKHLGYSIEDVKNGNIKDIKEKAQSEGIKNLSQSLETGEETLKDIINELLKPGRDPRDEVQKPVLKADVMDISQIKPEMVLTGTVRNVIDFGAFVDIGVHEDGLVHISQICDRYIKHPSDVLKVGDIVKVKVLEVDSKRKRIALTMRNI